MVGAEAKRRALLIGGVQKTPGRFPPLGRMMAQICDAWEPILQDIGFVDTAPFKTVSLIIVYGSRESTLPEIENINRRNSELPVTFELPVSRLRVASDIELKRMLEHATYMTLKAVAEKYGLPTALSLE